jgi:methyl-accepting chemotaxis protein
VSSRGSRIVSRPGRPRGSGRSCGPRRRTQTLDEIEDAVDELDNGIDELNGEGLSKQIKSANRFEAKIESLNRTLRRLANAGFETSELDEYVTDANGLLARIEEEVRAGNDEEAEELIEEAEELLDEAQDHFKDFRKEARKASKGTENDRGRPESSGIRGGDDDEDDDDVDDEDDGNNVTASSASQGSDNITEELEELATAISGIENTLGGLSANLSITDVELILENATALMEEARAIVEENPDGAEELVEAAEELVEEALDLIEDMTGHDDDDGLEAIEPEDDDDDDEIDDHGDDDPDDHGDDDEPETTV